MADIRKMYMNVSVDVMPEGLNLFIAISPDENPMWDAAAYPYGYVHVGVPCTWFVRANAQLSAATLLMCTEYADQSCAHANAVNALRRPVNRK